MNIHDLLSLAVGKTVDYSRTGGGAGSIWCLQFEDGNFYMINCAWRIDYNGVILTTDCDDGTALVGRMNKNAERLVGSKLLSYELSPQYDLNLYFENGFTVRAFCNVIFCGSEEDAIYHCNWDFNVPKQNIVGGITGHFKIVYTKYSDDPVES